MALGSCRPGVRMTFGENVGREFCPRVELPTITGQVKGRDSRLCPDSERTGHCYSVKKVLLPGGSTRYDGEQ
jgi:hypothetical protein